MEISNKDIFDAILNNDTAKAAEMLEGFDLTKDDIAPFFTSDDRQIVSIMLSAASVMSRHNNLDDDLAHELIERTATTVNIFPFLRLVVIGGEIEREDFDTIPEKIRAALRKNDYTDQIARAIEDLDADVLKTLLNYFISEEVKSSHIKFNLPVIRRIYSDEIIPADLMFALMASNLRDTVDEHFGSAMSTIGGLDLLGVLLGGMNDDDSDEEDHECDHDGCHGECGDCHGECGDCHGCHSDS